MARILSPDVYIIEKDISEYAPTVNSSVAGLVGFASKGPINKATLITSPQNLVRTFGDPSEHIAGQALEGAVEILETTNQVYFVRAADSATAADASSNVKFGSCPALQFKPNTYGTTNPLYLRVDVSSNTGVSKYTYTKKFAIPANTMTGAGKSQAKAIASIVGGNLDSDKVSIEFDTDTSSTGWIVGSWAGSGASLSVSAFSDNTYGVGKGVSALKWVNPVNGNVSGTFSSSITTFGSDLNTSGLKYVARTIHPGAGYNAGTKLNGDTSGNSIEIDSLGGKGVMLQVNQDGQKEEEFKVSLIENENWIEDEIQVGETGLKSDIIKGELYFSGVPGNPTKLSNFENKISTLGVGSTTESAGLQGAYFTPVRTDQGGDGPLSDYVKVPVTKNLNPRFVKPLESTYNMTGGHNGVPTDADDRDAALIGSETVDPKTGMQALSDDSLNISMAAVPGQHGQNVQNALITLAEATQEFIAVLSPPYAVGTVQNAIDWSNGRDDTRTAAINSSWAAVYWPHIKVFSVPDKKDIWMDPAVYGIRAMALTDNIGETWFAPAGSTRGRLTKPTEVEVIVNKGDRDALYTGGNIINPIAKFPQRGIMIFGQRTAQRKPSSLDRINVRRMMIFIMKTVRLATRDFIFEPNDTFTWALVKGVIDPLMDDIVRRRGITQFRVVCDETVNTPARVDRNELWCKVLIKPTKTAEALVFELNLTNQSADLGTL